MMRKIDHNHTNHTFGEDSTESRGVLHEPPRGRACFWCLLGRKSPNYVDGRIIALTPRSRAKTTCGKSGFASKEIHK